MARGTAPELAVGQAIPIQVLTYYYTHSTSVFNVSDEGGKSGEKNKYR